MNLENRLSEKVKEAVQTIYEQEVTYDLIQIQRTRREFTGDFTVVVFPLLRFSKKPPEQTGEEIGDFLKEKIEEVSDYNIIKGFLNLVIDSSFWLKFLNSLRNIDALYKNYFPGNNEKIAVEFSSPNTNKPLHLGHIRNNLLGYSVSRIFEASGRKVSKVNLVNDRGIHICKSMLAWKKWGQGVTPEGTGQKGDKLVGDFYVKFDQAYKEEQEELIAKGYSKEEAQEKSSLMREARKMLSEWEAGNEEVMNLWKMMNKWVLDGFEATYNDLGVSFDRTYYESEVYKKGKEEIQKGLEKNVFFRKSDGSVWADLSDRDLDQKILLRSDGTSVYMTQDIGTAIRRKEELHFDKHVYVVGNEQNYHFQVLKIILDKLGYEWSENLFHLAYGMVELPEGKMKSREGTVVDADDLIEEMIQNAREITQSSGKLSEFSDNQKEQIYKQIALGALKYFILKVDPKRNMTFDPKESIDFNGNTGPFIQYSYARINSLKDKADISLPSEVNEMIQLNDKEIQLIKQIHKYVQVIEEAAEAMNPSLIANYVYDLAKEYNQFYHDYSVLKADRKELVVFRLNLSLQVAKVIKEAMWLMGIDLPERM